MGVLAVWRGGVGAVRPGQGKREEWLIGVEKVPPSQAASQGTLVFMDERALAAARAVLEDVVKSKPGTEEARAAAHLLRLPLATSPTGIRPENVTALTTAVVEPPPRR